MRKPNLNGGGPTGKGVHHGFRDGPLLADHPGMKRIAGRVERSMLWDRTFEHSYVIADLRFDQNLRNLAHALYFFFSSHAARFLAIAPTADSASS